MKNVSDVKNAFYANLLITGEKLRELEMFKDFKTITKCATVLNI